MKRIFLLLFVMITYTVNAQQFVIPAGKDTLDIGNTDTVISINFIIKDASVRGTLKLSIKVNSGSAIQGKDFILLDAYNAMTHDIYITNIENKSGSFRISVRGPLDAGKTINLQLQINDNGTIVPDFAKLIIRPQAKKTEQEDKNKPKTETKKDSIEFHNYNDINISVYSSENNAQKKQKLINTSDIKITQINPWEYRFEIRNTENEIYISTIQITTEYQFKENDRLFLFGNPNGLFIHARDLFFIALRKKEETTPPGNDSTILRFKMN